LWDEQGQTETSEPAFFEMGLLDPTDWQARWICGIDTDRSERLPADCYQRAFSLNGQVRQARLYATALGIYEARLNGRRVEGFVLAPGCTQYDKRLYYQTYDVTDLLAEKNRLEFTVGDGWYKGKLGCDGDEYLFGQQTKLLAQLLITYIDGRQEIIATDHRFRWSNDGPLSYNDLKDGIVYDARKKPTYQHFAQETTYAVQPEASSGPPILEHETFQPKLLISPGGQHILDFGQNIAGYVRFRVRGQPGQSMKLSFCEVLDHGEYTDITFRTLPDRGKSIDQAIRFTMSGGEDLYEPNFFYAGFRYALVEGLDEVNQDDFTAIAVYSDLTMTGRFTCSHPLITQFAQNTLWSLKSNFVDVPTDCPTREKAGWTGDAQIFARTSTYLADTAAFYRKWLKDIRDCQRDDGRITNINPKVRPPNQMDVLNGSVGWADAAVIIPWTLWQTTGDETFIRDNLDLMRGWAAYVMKTAADKTMRDLPDDNPLKQLFNKNKLPDSPLNCYVIELGVHWGEWAEPLDVMDGVDGVTLLMMPKQEEAAAFTHYSMRLLAEMLTALGETSEAELYAEFAAGARAAYNHHFVKENDIPVCRQAKLVRPLALGLLDDAAVKNVARRLNESAIARNYKVGTGFLSTPFVLKVLAEQGYVETAYKMLENTKTPGWLAMVCQGATTVWENYDGFDAEGHPQAHSMNHFSPGAVSEFLFSHIAGIRISGSRHFTIRPLPGGSLTWAEASYDSTFGLVKSRWELFEGNIHYTISIPANTTAKIELPDGQSMQVGPGEHRF